jgi:uncharacterized protein YgbK (DUF1537 family)
MMRKEVERMGVLLGAIADDFTGATDLANTLVKAGMPTIQTFGIPAEGFDPGNAAAIIVALKSRSTPADEAIQESIEALEWLKSLGTKQFFFKYCSTFDSTVQGNIGPVADALLDNLGDPLTIACPAFPTNGRTIYKGHLFVGDLLLSESSMKDHPLTPMTDANLVRFLGKQTDNEVGLVSFEDVEAGAQAIKAKYDQLIYSGKKFAIVDAVNDDNLYSIGEASKDLKLITGGSGVALGLPENFRKSGDLQVDDGCHEWQSKGRAAILSGSCSAMTRTQVAAIKEKWPSFSLNAIALHEEKEKVIEQVLAWIDKQGADEPFLVYSSSDPADVAEVQKKLGRDTAGLLVEEAMGVIAVEIIKRGVERLVVAGGETSGAVVKSLGVSGLRIGKEIDPGVPWCKTMGTVNLSLALKSGNFGKEDFFTKAFEVLG